MEKVYRIFLVIAYTNVDITYCRLFDHTLKMPLFSLTLPKAPYGWFIRELNGHYLGNGK